MEELDPENQMEVSEETVSNEETQPEKLVAPENVPVSIRKQPTDEAYAKIHQFDNLKKTIDKGLPLPIKYSEPDMSEYPVKFKKESINTPFVLCEELRIECKLLSLKKVVTQALIKDSQGHSRLDFARAANALDSMSILDINKEMLLKNPEVVDTIRKLQRYFIHPDTVFRDRVERHLASNKAAHLRFKANCVVMEKFAPLFTIPSGYSFYEVYCTEMEKYHTEN